MRYMLTLPNYQGPFSFHKDGQLHSLPQSPSGAELDDKEWEKIKDAPEIQELQEAKLLHVLSESESRKSVAKTAASTESKTAEK